MLTGNKKGVIAPMLLLTIAGIIISAILIGFLLFSGTIRWIIIGIGVIIAAVYLTGQAMVGKFTRSKIIFLLLLFGVGIFLVFSSSLLQTTFGDDAIYKPRWGSLGCIEDDAHQSISKMADENYKFTCGENYLVDECRVYVSCDGTPWYFSGCGFSADSIGLIDIIFGSDIPEDTYRELHSTLQPGASITFTSSMRNAQYLKVEYEFNAYRLWTEEGGGHWLTRSSDCCLADQTEVERSQVLYGDWVCLDKAGSNKYKNYVIDWVPTVGEIYSYQERDVICGNNVLYELDTQQMADGRTYNIQGNYIKGVECCPYQTANCDSETFTFLPADEPEERECDYNYECENGGLPWSISDTQALQEKCIDGECVRETITTECGSDAKCRELYGDEYVCDLTFANFGKCIESGLIPLPFCGDGICQTGETSINCPVDCTAPPIVCEWWEESVPAGTLEDCGFLDWREWTPLVSCKTETYEASCTVALWVYLAGGAAVLILIIVIVVLLKPRTKTKKRRK